MDGPRIIILSVWYSKLERERQILYHSYVESKKMIPMNLFTKKKQTHKHRKETYGYQRGKVRGGIN